VAVRPLFWRCWCGMFRNL